MLVVVIQVLVAVMPYHSEMTCSPGKSKWVFPKIGGTILGVPIIRTIVVWGLYWGPPILGNYQIIPWLLNSVNPRVCVVSSPPNAANP